MKRVVVVGKVYIVQMTRIYCIVYYCIASGEEDSWEKTFSKIYNLMMEKGCYSNDNNDNNENTKA
jgi:hypothetical protein